MYLVDRKVFPCMWLDDLVEVGGHGGLVLCDVLGDARAQRGLKNDVILTISRGAMRGKVGRSRPEEGGWDMVVKDCAGLVAVLPGRTVKIS